MFRPSLTETLLLVLLAIATAFGGWNWWRKNVYYERIQTMATANAEQVAKVEEKLTTEAREAERQFKQEAKERERILQEHLTEIQSRPPADRVVYKLRDRWLPVSCPAGAADGAGATEVGGLHPEDEQDLVRLAHDADTVVSERNLAVQRYNAVRQAIIEHNKKVRR